MRIPSSIVSCRYLITVRPFHTLISGPVHSKPCFSPTIPVLPVGGAVGRGYHGAGAEVLAVSWGENAEWVGANTLQAGPPAQHLPVTYCKMITKPRHLPHRAKTNASLIQSPLCQIP